VILDPYRAFMIELASLSGDYIRPYFGNSDLKVDVKADLSPVTAADRGAEKLMRGKIHRRFPGHGVVGEEEGSENPDAEFVWVLDPIDGTKSFTAAVPLFGTLIALLHEGQPVLGCIHQPVLRQLVVGDNRTTTLNGNPIRTRAVTKVEEATLLTSDPAVLARTDRGRAYASLMEKARLARTWGDCYGYLLVSGGWADVMFDPVMNLWDIAALVPVIRGAGGVITHPLGGPAYPADATIASANETLHEAVLSALRG
jgi:myo-inositol-1(or 4)-monophosphatase